MSKVLWLILSLMMIAEARENPFETLEASKSVGKATQIEEQRENFDSTTYSLPSTARVLKSVTFSFQNLDGSISDEAVSVDKNVDWHDPLVVSIQKNAAQANPQTTTSTTPLPKASAPSTKTKEPEASVKKVTQEKVVDTLKFNATLSLGVNGDEISIFTKDTKVRDFLIADPYKVVVDFKKTTSFSTQTLEINHAPFVSATLGDHEGFYRIAILLDGHYRYDILPFNGGYVIKLK